MSETAIETIAKIIRVFEGDPDAKHPAYEECAHHILKALEANGWAVVPVEPSEAMQEAGYDALDAMDLLDAAASTVVTAYRAMIQAGKVKP